MTNLLVNRWTLYTPAQSVRITWWWYPVTFIVADSFARFNERARKALQYAQEEATRLQHNYIGTEHLLIGLLRVEDGVAAQVLRRLGLEVGKVRNAVEFIIGRGQAQFASELGLTPRAKKTLQLAILEAQQMNHQYMGTEHLLLGIIREGEGVAVGVIESFGVSLDRVRSAVGDVLSSAYLDEYGGWEGRAVASPRVPWAQFSPSPAPVVARDNEIEQLVNVLLRRTRHNPVLVGGEGSGRTTVVHGLLQRMATVELPIRLQFRRMLRLSASADLATIEATLRHARDNNSAVVVPQLERLPSMAIELLTSHLAHDGLRMTGITTPLGFEAMVAEHPSFAEQVQPVLVEELSVADAVSVLRLIVKPLEEHHSISIADDAFFAASDLAHQYQFDRLLPSSALELLDEAAGLARSRKSAYASANDVRSALQQLWAPAAITVETDPLATAERFRSEFAATLADRLVNAFAVQSRALLAYVSRGAHTRQFAQRVAASLFGTPAALVELDLAHSPWRLATSPPGRVWFPHEQQLADALRRNPRCVIVLSSAERATVAGLDLATHILRTRHLTDPLGRRLDLSQAAILVTAARGALIDPILMDLLPTRIELTRDWAR